MPHFQSRGKGITIQHLHIMIGEDKSKKTKTCQWRNVILLSKVEELDLTISVIWTNPGEETLSPDLGFAMVSLLLWLHGQYIFFVFFKEQVGDWFRFKDLTTKLWFNFQNKWFIVDLSELLF